MKKHVRIAAFFCAVILVLWTGSSLLERSHKRSLLPQKLDTGWYFAEGVCPYSDIMSHHSAFVFSLTDDAIAAIEREQVGFFADIREPGNAPIRRYFDGEWKTTPAPHEYAGDSGGLPGNLYCGQRSWFWPRGIKEELRQPGNYYQESGGRGLYVLPRLGVVVASVKDR
jgi:hypothetical protein